MKSGAIQLQSKFHERNDDLLVKHLNPKSGFFSAITLKTYLVAYSKLNGRWCKETSSMCLEIETEVRNFLREGALCDFDCHWEINSNSLIRFHYYFVFVGMERKSNTLPSFYWFRVVLLFKFSSSLHIKIVELFFIKSFRLRFLLLLLLLFLLIHWFDLIWFGVKQTFLLTLIFFIDAGWWFNEIFQLLSACYI